MREIRMSGLMSEERKRTARAAPRLFSTLPIGPCADSACLALKGVGIFDPVPASKLGVKMPVSAVSIYRGGTAENVTPLAKKMKAVLLKYGVACQVSRFQTGQNVGEWLVVCSMLTGWHTLLPRAQSRRKILALICFDKVIIYLPKQHFFTGYSCEGFLRNVVRMVCHECHRLSYRIRK
jgi:hypothetical protein